MNLRYVGPFDILKKIGEVAYRLALPPSLARVNNIFYVFMLKKYMPNLNHVMELEPLQAKKDLLYEEYPIQVVVHKK